MADDIGTIDWLTLMYKYYFSSLFSLTLLRAINTIYPLVGYVVLVRTFSSTEFSDYIFSMSVIAFIRLFTFYGFESFGVDIIAKCNRTKNYRKNSFILGILIIQVCLYAVSSLAALVILTLLSLDHRLVFTCLLIPFFEIFRVQWYFLGIQRIGYYTKFHLWAGPIYISIFYAIYNNLTEMLYVPLIYIISIFVPSIFCWIHACKIKVIQIALPRLKTIYFLLVRSTTLFKSRSLAVVNQEAVSLVLGANGAVDQLIIYDFMKKIVEFSKIPNAIINQAISPLISAGRDKILIRRTVAIRFFLSVISYIITVLFIEPASEVITGMQLNNLTYYILIYGTLIVLAPMNYFYSSSVLLPFNHANKIFETSLYGTGVLLIGLMFLHVTGHYELSAYLFLMATVELLIVLQRFWFIRRNILTQ